MKNTVTMAELMKKVQAYGQPQNLDEGFASDASRRAAFAQGYKAKGKKDKKEETLDEKLTTSQIATLKKTFDPLKGKKIGPNAQKKLMQIMDKLDRDKDTLGQLVKADIPFVSQLAVTRLISKHNMTGAQINKLKEETLDEKMKYTHAVVDNNGNVIGFTTNEKDAVFMSKNNLTKKKGAVVKLTKPMSQKQGDMKVGRKLFEEEIIDEMAYKPGSFKDTRAQEKGAKALADLAKTGGMDKKTFEKARSLYVQASDPASREKLKKFIFNQDTEPKEEIMNVIGMNDPETFLQMYPNAQRGEPLTRVSFAHRNMKSEETELEEMDMKFVLINMQNKIQGFTSNEKDAKEMARRTKSTMHPIKKKISDKTLERMNALARSPKELRDLGIIEQLAEAKDIKILVKDVKDRNFLKDLLNKAKDEKVMVGSPTPADKRAGKYVFVGPKDKVNNVFNYAFDKSINRGNYAPATMMHEGASEMLDEISRANANKVNSELSKILGKIRFTHFYQMGPKAIFKLPKNVKHEVVVNRNDMKDAADLLMKDKGDVGFMFKQGQLRLAKAMDSNVVEENELINKAAGYISHMQMAERIDPADIDDTASEKDIENAAKNIIMQLRKSVSMRGNKDVEFADGKKKVDMRIAQKAIDMHMKMRTSSDKLKFQNKIATSYKSLLNAIKGK